MLILIAEDELIISKAYERFLTKNGFEVKCFKNGNLLLDFLKLNQMLPFVMMLDMQLNSALTGMDIAKEVRKTLSTPIIFVTGNSEQKVKDEIQTVNNAHVLIKPVDYNELLRLLGSLSG